jgi:hypothetical protein
MSCSLDNNELFRSPLLHIGFSFVFLQFLLHVRSNVVLEKALLNSTHVKSSEECTCNVDFVTLMRETYFFVGLERGVSYL